MVALQHSSPDAVRLLERGTIALARIEANGVCVDRKRLKAAIAKTDERIAGLQASMEEDRKFNRPWRKRFGDKLNYGSRDQMRDVLFKDLGFRPIKKTDTGLYSVDKEVLNHIDEQFVRDFLKCEELKKIRSTYLIGLHRELVRHADGDWYVHPIYNLNTAVTYRSSCQLINFQNQPVRNPEAADIVRSCYVAPAGYYMAEIDFSGVEVKVAACYNKDPNLIRYIKDPSGTDMHRDQAARIFKVPKEYLTKYKDLYKKTIRDSSKNQFVFPQFYGSVYFQCAPNMWEALNDKQRDFKLTPDGPSIREHLRAQGIKSLGDCDPKGHPRPGTFVHRVQQVEREMWEKDFPVYARWKRSWWDQYQKEGGFTTYTGFRVNLHLKRNEVINSPIQGSAFHCLLWTLIEMTNWLKKNKMRSKVVGQIHDSMLMYLHPKEKDEVLSYAKYLMTEKLPEVWKWIIVPMETETELSPIGGAWSEKKQYIEQEDGTWQMKA